MFRAFLNSLIPFTGNWDNPDDLDGYEKACKAEVESAKDFVAKSVNLKTLRKIALFTQHVSPTTLGFARGVDYGESTPKLTITESSNFDIRRLGVFLALVITMRSELKPRGD